MARKRMIDPRIWDSEQVMQLSPQGFKLYIYLISQADDEGKLPYCKTMVTARVFPFGGADSQEVDSMVKEMDKIGLIKRYVVAEKEYIQHPNWTRYQKIDRPSPSTIPNPVSLDERSTKRKRTLVPNRIEVNRKEDKEIETYAEGVTMTKTEYSALVGQYGENVVKLAISKVAAQQIKTGKPYKSPRGAILQWGIRAALEEIKKVGPVKQADPECPECHVSGGNHGAFCSRGRGEK